MKMNNTTNRTYVRAEDNKLGIEFGWLSQRQIDRIPVLFCIELQGIEVKRQMLLMCGHPSRMPKNFDYIEEINATKYCKLHENQMYTTDEEKRQLLEGLNFRDGYDELVVVIQEINWKMEFHKMPYRVIRDNDVLVLKKL